MSHMTSLSQGIADERVNVSKTMKMQCFPLYTLLLALGNPTVDFLSLDIEVSLAVFQVIPNLNCSTKGSRVGGVTDYSMVKGALLFKYMILFANFYFKIFVLW